MLRKTLPYLSAALLAVSLSAGAQAPAKAAADGTLIDAKGMTLYTFDKDAGGKSAGDAVWWSVCSLTTVGYGDVYPISFEGRVLAMIVLLCGVGLFGTVSGMMASFFVGDQGKEEEEAEQEILQQLAVLNERVASLQQQLQANKPAPPAG